MVRKEDVSGMLEVKNINSLFYVLLVIPTTNYNFVLGNLSGTPVEKVKGVIISETDSPASPTGPDSGNPNAPDIDSNAPVLPPKPGIRDV